MPIPIEPVPLRTPSFLHDLAISLGAEYASKTSDVLVAPASIEMSRVIHWTTPQHLVEFLGQEELCFLDTGDHTTPPTIVPIGDIVSCSSLHWLVFSSNCDKCNQSLKVLVAHAEDATIDFLDGSPNVPIRDITVSNFRFLSRWLKIAALDAGVFFSEDELGFLRSTCPHCKNLVTNERRAIEQHTSEHKSIRVAADVVLRGGIIELAEPWDSTIEPAQQALNIIRSTVKLRGRRPTESAGNSHQRSENGVDEVLTVIRTLNELEQASAELKIPLFDVPNRDKNGRSIHVSLLRNNQKVSTTSVNIPQSAIKKLQRFIFEIMQRTGALNQTPSLSYVYLSLSGNNPSELQISSVSTHEISITDFQEKQ